jgi:hypothetical protein
LYTLYWSFLIVALSYGIVLAQINQGLEVFANLGSVNDSEVVMSNGSMQVPNQYIIIMQNSSTDSNMQALINELENRGAQIIGRYDELFQGFAFKTQDNQTAKKIIEFLETNPQVQSLTPDRTASITPENKGKIILP